MARHDPIVDNFVIDENSNRRFIVRAFRKLEQEESLALINLYFSQHRNMPKEDGEVRITTLIGLSDLN